MASLHYFCEMYLFMRCNYVYIYWGTKIQDNFLNFEDATLLTLQGFSSSSIMSKFPKTEFVYNYGGNLATANLIMYITS